MSLQNDDLRAVAVSALYEKNANDKTPMDLVSIGDTCPKYEFLLFGNNDLLIRIPFPRLSIPFSRLSK